MGRKHRIPVVVTVLLTTTALAGLALVQSAPAAGPNYTCADAPAPSGAPAGAPAGSGTFAFAAGGDMGCSPDAAATLEGIHGAGVDFALHFGDMAYDQAAAPYETTWCNFVKDRVGADFPYELVTGGHDLGEGTTKGAQYEGSIDNYVKCLPDHMASSSAGG